MKKVDPRFSMHHTDLAAMQASVEAVIADCEKIVREAIAAGMIDADLLRAALGALAHASARAQVEYDAIKESDDTLPEVWTAISFSSS